MAPHYIWCDSFDHLRIACQKSTVTLRIGRVTMMDRIERKWSIMETNIENDDMKTLINDASRIYTVKGKP